MRENGWVQSGPIDGLADWLHSTIPHAETLIAAPENQRWLRAGGTWYAGVNLLNNDHTGAVQNGPPLPPALLAFVREHTGVASLDNWDTGQLSVVYPGYPKQDPDESDASHRFRLNRDAAHVDGLHPVGEKRRRHANEHHAFVLGIPWIDAPDGASPLAVWEGSHHIIRDALSAALGHVNTEDWPSVDLTDVYHAARREAFDTCTRVEVSADRGCVYLVHRLALHGIAPWRTAETSGLRRAVCYFRPALHNAADWLTL